MTLREKNELREKSFLSSYATLSSESKGRKREEVPCDIRMCFQRDRDRIIHCKSFRRLKHKTQVFLAPEGDHYRTRLTHTLEVAQIARTIARALMINEDLTEAIALGHDLGHTPFGHAGERALNQVAKEVGFEHSKQSIRIVERLEQKGKGLNLCYEVLDGIENHQTKSMPSTLEGKVVRLSDKIAYINHDIDDAIRAGVLSIDDIPKDIIKTLGRGHSERINTMVRSVIDESYEKPFVKMNSEISEATNELRNFLFENVYHNKIVKAEEDKAIDMIKTLFEYFTANYSEMPKLYRDNCLKDGVDRSVCDYISSMTDRYAIKTFSELYVPDIWRSKK